MENLTTNEIAQRVKERVKESVLALLKAEGVDITDTEGAQAALKGCALPKKCLEAYREILDEHNSFVYYKNFTYSVVEFGDSDFTGSTTEELQIEGGYFFSSSGTSANLKTRFTEPKNMPAVCLYTISEALADIKKNTDNIKIERIKSIESGRKITGKINLKSFLLEW